jgi:endonuclease G
MAGVEAIIYPDKRPAFDIIDGDFRVTHPIWQKLEDDEDIHARLVAAIPRIGRIELLHQSSIPFGGTGFVVGDGLLMTNRHVAEIFARGLGDRQVAWSGEIRPGFNLRRERGKPPGTVLEVRRVRMIHPWWDMALLEVAGLPTGLRPLRLSVADARDLANHDVAVIGYPAYDPLRNDPDVQNALFDRTYGVKRLQPGMLAVRRQTESFGKLVDAATHDCSTLGGNSGSAIIELDTGDVLALHFGGRYLDTNYAVPVAELARDGRVRDAGVNFAGSPPAGPPPDWVRVWDNVEASLPEPDDGPPRSAPGLSRPVESRPPISRPSTMTATSGRITFETPLRISVELGAPGPLAPRAETAAPESVDITEAMREPEHDIDYRRRPGYDPHFLEDVTVAIPRARDPSVLAPVKTGGTELKYQNFSILMHAARKLALVTASNVTRESELRKPEPGRDYTRKGLSGLGRNDRELWFTDPRLDPRYQLSDIFYTRDRGAFDKGHIVRREDVAWGETYELLRRANGDTYHVTNCSPQVAEFNRSAAGEDNWGDLENLVLSEAANERLCIFAGPFLEPADETFVGRSQDGRTLRVKIPSRFWKVVIARTQTSIAAYGFVLEQDLSQTDLEFVVSENFRRLQVPLSAIEDAVELDFGDTVRRADTFDSDRGMEAAWRGGLERVETLARRREPEEDTRPTPNAGDDAEAEPDTDRRAPGGEDEAPPKWRVARSLLQLRQQIDARAPNRNRASDGTIGDAAHASRNSDHNPWVRDGTIGIVTAMDITHAPQGGCDAGALANAIVNSRDARVKYVIWNRRISNSSSIGGNPPWTWRPYRGANPHNKHVHISVLPEKSAYDDARAWQV